MARFPSKRNALAYMREIGIEFGTIIDVGTHAQTPELIEAFPLNRHVLFEPASEFFAQIAENYLSLDWELVPFAVSDVDGVGRLHKIAIADDQEISHSKLVYDEPSESEMGGLGVIDITTIRLDTYFHAREDKKPYFLKIDVDGFEMPILRGAEGIWEDIDCIVIEATAQTFMERLSYIMSRGFHLFDIVDQCYYSGIFSQSDLIFVSDRLQQSNPQLRPWQTETFAWEKWVPVANYEAHLPAEEG